MLLIQLTANSKYEISSLIAINCTIAHSAHTMLVSSYKQLLMSSSWHLSYFYCTLDSDQMYGELLVMKVSRAA